MRSISGVTDWLLRMQGDPSGATDAIRLVEANAVAMGARMVSVTETINTAASANATLAQNRLDVLTERGARLQNQARVYAVEMQASQLRINELTTQQRTRLEAVHQAETNLAQLKQNVAQQTLAYEQQTVAARQRELTLDQQATRAKQESAAEDSIALRLTKELETVEQRIATLQSRKARLKNPNTATYQRTTADLNQRILKREQLYRQVVIAQERSFQADEREQQALRQLTAAETRYNTAKRNEANFKDTGTAAIRTAEAQVLQLRTQAKAATEQLGQAERQLNSERSQLNSTVSHLESNEKKVYSVEKDLASQQGRNLTATYKFMTGLQQLGETGTRVAERVSNAGLAIYKSFNGIYVKLQGMSIGLAAAGQSLTMFAQQGENFLGSQLTQLGDFQDLLVETASVVSKVPDEVIKPIEDIALVVGRDTKYSAQEALTVTNQLIRSGLTLQQVAGTTKNYADGATRAVTDLSAATGAELATSTETVATATNVFASEQLKASEATDAAGKAVNSANITLKDFNDSMKQAGPIAAELNIPYRDVAEAIALLGRNAIKGSSAGTALKYLWENAVPKSQVALQTMERYGLATFNTTQAVDKLHRSHVKFTNSYEGILQGLYALSGGHGKLTDATSKEQSVFDKWLQQQHLVQSAFFDAQGQFKGTRDMILQLTDALNKVPEDQKLQVLRDVFGLKAGSQSAAVLLNTLEQAQAKAKETGQNVADVFLQISGAMNQMSSPAQIAIEKMNTMAGKAEYLKGSLSSLVTEVLEPMEKPITAFLGFIGQMVNGFESVISHDEQLKQMVSMALLLGIAFAHVAGVLLLAGAARPYVMAGLSGIAAAALPVVSVLILLASAFMGVGVALLDPSSGLSQALMTLLHTFQTALPILQQVRQIVLVDIMGPLSKGLRSVFTLLLNLADRFFAQVLVRLPAAAAATGRLLQGLGAPVGFLIGIFGQLAQVVINVAGWLIGAWPGVVRAIQGAGAKLAPVWHRIQAGIQGIVTFIQQHLLPTIQLVIAWLAEHLPTIRRQIAEGFLAVKPILDAVGTALGFVAGVVVSAIPVFLYLADQVLTKLHGGFYVTLVLFGLLTTAATVWATKTAVAVAQHIRMFIQDAIITRRSIGLMIAGLTGLVAKTTWWVVQTGVQAAIVVAKWVWLAAQATVNAGIVAARWVATGIIASGGLVPFLGRLIGLGLQFAATAVKAGISAAAFLAQAAASGLAAAGTWLVNTAMAALDVVMGLLDAEMLPVIATILVIAAVMFLLYKAWSDNWFGIQDVAKNVLNTIVGWYDKFLDWLNGVVNWLGDTYNKLTGQSGQAAHDIIARFKRAWDSGLTAVQDGTAIKIGSIQDLLKVFGFNAGVAGGTAGSDFLTNLMAGIDAGIPELDSQLQEIENSMSDLAVDEMDVASGIYADPTSGMKAFRHKFHGIEHTGHVNTAPGSASYGFLHSTPRFQQLPLDMTTDTDGDGIPDSIDPYPKDPNNGRKPYTGNGANPYGPAPKGGSGRNRAQSAAQTAADIVQKTADAIKAGIAAFKQLRTLQVPANLDQKAKEFADAAARVVVQIQRVRVLFNSKDDAVLKNVASFADRAGKCMDLIAKGVDRFKALSQFKAPLQSQVDLFVQVIRETVRRFETRSKSFTLDSLVFTGEFADTARKVVDLIGKGVDAFAKLKDFRAPMLSEIQALVDSVEETLKYLSPIASSWAPQALDDTSAFADAAGKVADGLSKGVDFLSKLGKDKTDYKDLAGRVQELANATQHMMNTLGPLTKQWTTEFTDQVGAFADRSSKVADGLGKSIDFLDKLKSSKTPFKDLAGRVVEIANATQQMANVFGPLTQWWTKDRTDETGQFADRAGKVADSLSKTIDLLDKLRHSKTPFKDLATRVSELAGMTAFVAETLKGVAVQWTDLTGPVGTFADTAGKVADALGKSMDMLDKLRKDPRTQYKNLAGRVQELVNALRDIMARMAAATPKDWDDGTIPAFSDTVGKVAGALSRTLDLLAKLGQSQKLGDRNQAYQLSQQLTAMIRGYQNAMITAGLALDDSGVEASTLAGEVADRQTKVVGALSRTFDLFTKLGEYVKPRKFNPQAVFADVLGFLRDIVRQFSAVREEFEGEVDDQTRRLADNIGKTVSGLGAALDLFIKLEDFTGVSSGRITRFIDRLRFTVAKLRDGLLTEVTPDMLDLAKEFGDKLGPAFDVLSKAFDLFNNLMGTSETDAKGKTTQKGGLAWTDPNRIFNFINRLKFTLEKLKDGLLNKIAPELLDVAQEFGTKIGPRMDVLDKALGIFLKLQGDGTKDNPGYKGNMSGRVGALVYDLYVLLVNWKNVVHGGEFQGDFAERSEAFAQVVGVVLEQIQKVLDLATRIAGAEKDSGAVSKLPKLMADIAAALAQVLGVVLPATVGQAGQVLDTLNQQTDQKLGTVTDAYTNHFNDVRSMFQQESLFKTEGTLTWWWVARILGTMIDRLEGKNGAHVQIRVGMRNLLDDVENVLMEGSVTTVAPWVTAMQTMINATVDAVNQVKALITSLNGMSVTLTVTTSQPPTGNQPPPNQPPPNGNPPVKGNGVPQSSGVVHYNIGVVQVKHTTDLHKMSRRQVALASDPS